SPSNPVRAVRHHRRRSSVAVQRPVRDVATMERAVVVDFLDGSVGMLAGGGKIVAERADGEHAAAGGNRTALWVEFGAGVENLDLGRGGGIQPVDHVPAAHPRRITRGSQYHADGRPAIPA